MSDAENLGLSPGTVIHIRRYSSRGHPPRNKYLFLIGPETRTTIAAFLVSSQQHWRESKEHAKEMVCIPNNATNFLSSESFIQCWVLERLDLDSLRRGFENGSVRAVGKLPLRYLYKVRDTARESYLLQQRDIEAVVRIVSETNR